MTILAIAILVVLSSIGLILTCIGIRLGMRTVDKYKTSGKEYVIIGVCSLVIAVALSGVCFWFADKSENENLISSDTTVEATAKPIEKITEKKSNGSSDSDNTSDTFSNKYGTSLTKCAISDCENYIAKSGDTNCCTAHSNKCAECYCYIDSDAMYCMDCISEALDEDDDNGDSGSSDNSGSSSSGSFGNKYGTSSTKCAVANCDNNIAGSGDTNCCAEHSNKCVECYCYIDSDAMYCTDCLSNAIGTTVRSNSTNDQECYVCREKAYSKYGNYYYCSDCLEIVKTYAEQEY